MPRAIWVWPRSQECRFKSWPGGTRRCVVFFLETRHCSHSVPLPPQGVYMYRGNSWLGQKLGDLGKSTETEDSSPHRQSSRPFHPQASFREDFSKNMLFTLRIWSNCDNRTYCLGGSLCSKCALNTGIWIVTTSKHRAASAVINKEPQARVRKDSLRIDTKIGGR